MKKLVFVLGIVFSSFVSIAQPTQCAEVALQAIEDQGGLEIGSSYEWIVPSDDVIQISTGTDGVINATLNVNGVVDSDGYYEAIAGDNLEIIGILTGFDDANVYSGSFGYTCPDWGVTETNDLQVTSALPVTWSKPTKVEKINNSTVVTFSTAQQINNSHFEIEHSQDGRQYQPIGKIEGEGNTNKEIDYEFIHDTPSFGINYYRVKQIDLDGQYSFSNVASVMYRTDKTIIYPNPVNNLLTIDSPKDGNVVIYNHLGSKVAEMQLLEGKNTLDMTQMEIGLYLVKFTDGSVERVVKK